MHKISLRSFKAWRFISRLLTLSRQMPENWWRDNKSRWRINNKDSRVLPKTKLISHTLGFKLDIFEYNNGFNIQSMLYY